MASKDKQTFDSIRQGDSPVSSLSPSDMWNELGGTPPPSCIVEIYKDFYGLPSCPLSIYRTGNHTGPVRLPSTSRHGTPNEARPVCDHAIAPVWHVLGEEVYRYFDSVGLKWTSIDPVRFAQASQEPGPLFLWVGVMPKTLSRNDAEIAAIRCKEILARYEISSVGVSFRESVYTRSARFSPQLLSHIPLLYDCIYPTGPVCGPFTATLGLRIASKACPYVEGTGCLYLREGSERDRVLLLAPRHVVLPASVYSNDLYNGKPYSQVILLGSKAYQAALEAIRDEIETKVHSCEYNIDRLALNEGDVPTERKRLEDKLAKAEASVQRLNEFYSDITRTWSLESQRALGRVLYAPPISVHTAGDKRFTEDWALVELNPDKFNNWNNFQGNVIYLGTKLKPGQFATKMYPDPEARAKYKCPDGDLMQLQDFVKDSDLRRSTMLDANGEPCCMVFKNGTSTGGTIGRASGLESFVRHYDECGIQSTSMEIAIYPYSHEDGAFSAPGDSGSVIGDANNRIIGMLTGGTGRPSDSTDVTHVEPYDVTYVTPYYFLHERIKEAFPDYQLYPFPTPT